MFNLQGSEIIIILLLALVVLGPEKLPDAIRKFSQTYGELKKMGNGFQSELRSALEEPMQEMRETADLVPKAADPQQLVQEAEDEARLRARTDAASAAGLTDIPVDSAAIEVADPAVGTEPDLDAAAAAAADADSSDPGAELAPLPDVPDVPINGSNANANANANANGTNPNQAINQIAASMARGPVDVEPVDTGALAPPSGPAAHLPPPPPESMPADDPVESSGP